jgi:hypothetical protein
MGFSLAKFDFPHGQSFASAYPLGIHGIGVGVGNAYSGGDDSSDGLGIGGGGGGGLHPITWIVRSDARAFANGSVASSRCTGVAREGDTNCLACASLEHNVQLTKVMKRACVPPEKVPLAMNINYMSAGQLGYRVQHHVQGKEWWRLRAFNLDKRLKRCLNTLGMHKRLLLLLRSNDVPRLQHVMASCVRKGFGIKGILSELGRAVDGLTRAGHFEGKEIDLALTVLHLGGPSLLYTLSKAIQLPSLSTVRRRADTAKVTVCGKGGERYIRAVIRQNIVALAKRLPGGLKSPWSLMIDEVSVEERARYKHDTNEVLGFCIEHTGEISIQLGSLEDLLGLVGQVESNGIHLAKEAYMVAVAPHRATGYRAMPLLVAGTCKGRNEELQKLAITIVTEEWQATVADEFGSVYDVASDGDGIRRRLFNKLFLEHDDHDIAQSPCSRLPLFHYEGRKELQGMFDPKHAMKRFRGRVIGARGMKVSEGPAVTKAILGDLFRLQGDESGAKASSLLDPSDRQNVPLAMSLITRLKGLVQDGELRKTLNDSQRLPLLQTLQQDVALVSLMGQCMTGILVDVNAALPALLTQLSQLSHLLFVVYRAHVTAFLPGQLYHDMQVIARGAYITVARMQADFPELPCYPFFLGTDRLENVFAVLRTISHSRNFDMLELESRVSTASALEEIYSRHPEWKRVSRRLNGSLDHMNPHSWLGDMSTKNVSLDNCWAAGRQKAISALRLCASYKDISEMSLLALRTVSGLTMLQPFGRDGGVPGVTVDDDGDDDGDFDNETDANPPCRLAATNESVARVRDVEGTALEEKDEEVGAELEEEDQQLHEEGIATVEDRLIGVNDHDGSPLALNDALDVDAHQEGKLMLALTDGA